MAVLLVSRPARYVGLSSDTKPTLAAVASGSTFYETDTGASFVHDGAAWQRAGRGMPP